MGTPLHQWVLPWKSTERYHYYTVWIRETGAKIVSDTVYFKHKYITNPTVTPEDAVIQEAQQLPVAFKGKLKTTMEKSGIYQLNKLDAIFNMTAEKFW